jgi:hypothetical protein
MALKKKNYKINSVSSTANHNINKPKKSLYNCISKNLSKECEELPSCWTKPPLMAHKVS